MSFNRDSAFNISKSDISILQGLKTAEDIRLYVTDPQESPANDQCEEIIFRLLARIIAKIFNVSFYGIRDAINQTKSVIYLNR